MFKNIKKDWWFWNSLFWLLSGLLVIVNYLILGDLVTGLFSGGLNILIGAALLKRSKIGYWLALFFAGFTFVGQISRLITVSKETGDFPIDISFVVSVVILTLAIMLWQQVRKEKKK